MAALRSIHGVSARPDATTGLLLHDLTAAAPAQVHRRGGRRAAATPPHLRPARLARPDRHARRPPLAKRLRQLGPRGQRDMGGRRAVVLSLADAQRRVAGRIRPAHDDVRDDLVEQRTKHRAGTLAARVRGEVAACGGSLDGGCGVAGASLTRCDARVAARAGAAADRDDARGLQRGAHGPRGTCPGPSPAARCWALLC